VRVARILCSAFIVIGGLLAACGEATSQVSAQQSDAAVVLNDALPQLDVVNSGFDGSTDGSPLPEPPACIQLQELDARPVSSGAALFVRALSCAGDPVQNLDPNTFDIYEDGQRNDGASVLSVRGQETIVSLVLDLSAATLSVRTDLIETAKIMATDLAQGAGRGRVQLMLHWFAGEVVNPLGRSTLDLAEALNELEKLKTLVPGTPNVANLNGAFVASFSRTQNMVQTIRGRNGGAPLVPTYLVSISSGVDSANATSLASVTSNLSGNPIQRYAIVLPSAGYNAAARQQMQERATAGVIEALSVQDLRIQGRVLAKKILDETKSTYLLGYCSPSRAGQHSVEVRVKAPKIATRIARFSLALINDGTCSAQTFACGSNTCGGLACGVCDDRSEVCATTSSLSRCVDACKERGLCGGAPLSLNGYNVVCSDRSTSTECVGECVDLTTNPLHCGACFGDCGSQTATCNGNAATCQCAEGPCPKPFSEALGFAYGGYLFGYNGFGIVRVSEAAGGPAIRIVDEPMLTRLAVGAGYVYFSVGNRLERVALDGSGRTVVWQEPETIEYVLIDNNYVYVQIGWHLVRIPHGAGTARTIVFDGFSGFLSAIAGGKAIMFDNAAYRNSLATVDFDTGLVTLLAAGATAGPNHVSGSDVYYTLDGKTLLKVNVNTYTTTPIISTPTQDYIYWYVPTATEVLYGEGDKIYRRPHGGVPTAIAGGQPSSSDPLLSGTRLYWTSRGRYDRRLYLPR
jgi:hypothetical protein